MTQVVFKEGLIPVITQDHETKEVLILSYMNEEAYQKTLEEKVLYYYSRSRQTLWKKGETSGHTQELMSLTLDCDGDALLALVKQKGPACHTGEQSCFHKNLIGVKSRDILSSVMDLIDDRFNKPKEGSYTTYLFSQGKEKILKKLGEEASEVIIASMTEKQSDIIYEIADLVYHTLVLLRVTDISLTQVKDELKKRYKP